MQIVYDRGLVQMGKFGHIVRLVKFGGVYFVNRIRIYFALLQYPLVRAT